MHEKLTYEYQNWKNGFQKIAGIDEAGRGPLAGPVVAAAVIFPKNFIVDNVKDSKKLSEKDREGLFVIIRENSISYGIGIATVEEIDKVNILQATFLAMKRAIDQLNPQPDLLLIDGRDTLDLQIPSKAIVKGDDLSFTISAASILAKVTRDRLMKEYHEMYPDYNFGQHKGYGTAAHRKVIQQIGACPIHRKTFLRKILK